MRTTKWDMKFAGWQNELADANLRHFLGADPQWIRQAHRTAATVREPSAAMLHFAYLDLAAPASGPRARQALEAVRHYSAHPGVLTRLVLPTSPKPTRLRKEELAVLQRDLRTALARLVIGYDADGVDLSAWETGEIRVVLAHVRDGPAVLSDITAVSPRWGRELLGLLAVLESSTPWLRYCALCGRLFFKVKRKLLCSRTCAVVYQARRGRAGRRPGERRGRRQTDLAEPVAAEHNAWIRAARA
ncbi:MAG: hypothetical protein HY002_06875 [Candidatus Rokubacteria bacterium]|nr:hypothetical protein [Candidatus Rokubacteria bacterium]